MTDPATAYDRLVKPLEQRMIRGIWRITRNGNDADDALQNALVTIWNRWQRVVAHPHPEALILRIALDAALDLLRRRLRYEQRHTRAEPHEQIADRQPGPHQALAAQEQTAEILAAIAALSPSQATAVALRVFEELPYDAIAAALGCGEATARKHVERGRARLRVALANHAPQPRSLP